MTQKSNPHQHSANESDIVTRTKDKQKMKKKNNSLYNDARLLTKFAHDTKQQKHKGGKIQCVSE